MAFPEGWTKQKPITLGGSVDDELLSYQSEELVIPWEEGMLEDFGDIRFYLDDETTELPYILSDYTSGVEAVFKIKPDTISETGLSIIIIFGNPEATTTSLTPDEFYEQYEGCTGTFSERWDIAHSGSGSQGYDTVDGKAAIKISNSGDYSLIVSKDLELSNPFKIEFDMYVADYVALIHYGLTPPVSGEADAYRARIDIRYGEPELIDYGGNQVGDAYNVTSNQGEWQECILTVDQNDYHIFKVDGDIGGEGNGYDSGGYIGFESTWDGYSAFSNIRVSKYTANPPEWGEWGETQDIMYHESTPGRILVPSKAITPGQINVYPVHTGTPGKIEIEGIFHDSIPGRITIPSSYFIEGVAGLPGQIEVNGAIKASVPGRIIVGNVVVIPEIFKFKWNVIRGSVVSEGEGGTKFMMKIDGHYYQ